MDNQYEEKWLRVWEKEGVSEAEVDTRKQKIFVNAPFPYMNGPLHIGHAFTYTRLDVFARYMRMKGYNVLFPFAWHWTGEAVAGQSVRLMKGDPAVIRAFVEIDGIPKEELARFSSPFNLAEYYTRVSRIALKKLGLSIDWRREFFTTSYNKGFSRFVEWQYLKLRSKNYVVKGSHPVVWCPFDLSPTGDHDRLEGEGVSPEQFYLVYFKINDAFLAAATFRPETVYGTTNVWLHPDGTYVKAKVNGSILIVSKEFTQKIIEQDKKVEILETFSGRDLVGKSCIVPLAGQEVPILPASFVDIGYGTGVVYSVPAHAPYDWLALREIQQSPPAGLECIVKDIKPISIIKVEGFGEYPALEVVDQLNVKDQNDRQAEKATEIVYSKEFHTGTMKENCGQLSGIPVKDAKTVAVERLVSEGLGDVIYDLPQSVRCRCGTKCVVKILRDQWFLNYGNLEWKNMLKEHVKKMQILPEEARPWILATIDWLRNWPCARKTGMGTPMPWDKEWIIETLSDSTIYMVYYIISKYVNEGKVLPDQMTLEFFDYVVLGEGKIQELSQKTGIDFKLIQRIRDDFLYWYPVDLRNSAKELIPNHLTFFLFQHIAIFPEEMWPKGISVNGMITVEGEKMSKSRGIFTTISQEMEKYGADIVRAALVYGAEQMDDPDWNEGNAKLMQQKINSVSELIHELREKAIKREIGFFERLLLAEVKRMILDEGVNLEHMKTKTAFQLAFFDIQNALRRYLKQVEKPEKLTIEEVIDYWVKALAPFIPFTCEENWHLIGRETFIVKESWPSVQLSEEDEILENQIRLVERLVSDIKEIKKIVATSSDRAYIYVAPKEFTRMVINYFQSLEKGLTVKDAIRKISESGEYRKFLNYIPQLVKFANTYDKDMIKSLQKVQDFDEFNVCKNNIIYIEKETGTKLEIFLSDQNGIYDPKKKAKNALPFRPAIYLE